MNFATNTINYKIDLVDESGLKSNDEIINDINYESLYNTKYPFINRDKYNVDDDDIKKFNENILKDIYNYLKKEVCLKNTKEDGFILLSLYIKFNYDNNLNDYNMINKIKIQINYKYIHPSISQPPIYGTFGTEINVKLPDNFILNV